MSSTLKPKAKVYIDGANMFYVQKDVGFFIDWNKMRDYLSERYTVLEIRYYVGVKNDDEKMRSYLRYLDAIGILPVTKQLKVIKIDKSHVLAKTKNFKEIYKCNFDVEMTADIFLDRSHLDEIVLFSGDSDFDYLVKKLRDLGKSVVIFSSRKMISWELRLSAKKHVFLEDLRERIERK